MNILFFSLSIIFIIFSLLEANGEKLVVTTLFYQEDNLLHLRMRVREPHLEPDRNTNVLTKKRICQDISPTLSRLYKEDDIVDVYSKNVYAELKSKYPDIFHALYKQSENSKIKQLVYTNPTQLFNVDSGNYHSEYGFMCLLRDRTNNKIIGYYVSDAYNMRKAVDNTSTDVVVGRFIFRKFYEELDQMLIGLAEEPAKIRSSNQNDIEEIYLQIRKNHKPVKTPDEDAVCSLDRRDKIRLCASVLNSSHFVGTIEYLLPNDLLDDNCEKMQVSFRTKTEADDFEEWVLSCLAHPIVDDAHIEYFVSRAYSSGEAFVYIRDYQSRKLYIENLSTNVSVIADAL